MKNELADSLVLADKRIKRKQSIKNVVLLTLAIIAWNLMKDGV